MYRSHSYALYILGAVLLWWASAALPTATAQEMPEGEPQSSVRPEFAASFIVAQPTGAFYDNLGRAGVGGNLYLGLGFNQSPFAIGIDFSFAIYGSNTQTVPFSRTIRSVTVDVTTTNNFVQPHLVLRLQQPEGIVRPYLDGLVGFKYLFTETRIRDEDRFDNDEIASSTNFDDVAFSYGAGAGLDVRLYRFRSTEPKGPRALYLKLGAQYLLGGEAEYLREGELEDLNDNGVIDDTDLDIRRSRTNTFIPQIGVALTF